MQKLLINIIYLLIAFSNIFYYFEDINEKKFK